jgi:signal transduction histidine kinase
VSGLIEANFLDRPLEDVAYLQESLSLRSDHSVIIILRELDAGITAIRKTGENILIASKELDKAARGNVDGFIQMSRIAILIIFPLFLIVGFGSMLLIISNVVKRLQLLSDLAEKTGTGDFAHIEEPVPSWGKDEVGQLIRKFNAMEDQLSQREKELLQSRKLAAIGTLASGVAHELNNPLNNIYTTAQRLMKKSGDDTPPYLRKGLDDIFGQTMRVKSIVSDLLEFARGREPHYHAVELKGLINGAFRHVANTRNMSAIRFQLKLAPDEIVLYADAEQLEQIFVNLIVNAADAMSGEGDLSIRAIEDEHAIRITITDSGKGMPAAIEEKIFEPFFTTKDKGTGLGLAIVFNLIQKHQGSITVESTEGRGATFTITLPQKAP